MDLVLGFEDMTEERMVAENVPLGMDQGYVVGTSVGR